MTWNLDSTNGVSATGNIVTDAYFLGYGQFISNINSANIGNLGNIASDIIPNANVTYSLGNSTNQWAELYLSGNTLYINSVPLSMTAGNILAVNGTQVVVASNAGTPQTSNIATTANINAGNADITTGNLIFFDASTQSSVYGSANAAAYLEIYPGNLNSIDSITSSGALSVVGSIDVAGDTTADLDIQATNLIANLITGTLDVGPQPNVTLLGTLSNLVVVGNMIGNTLQVSNNSIFNNLSIVGNISIPSNISNITGSNVNYYGNVATGFGAGWVGLTRNWANLQSTVVNFSGYAPAASQVLTQNFTGALNSTADIIAAADNSDGTNNIVDFGFASSLYNGLSAHGLGDAVQENDGYLFVRGNSASATGGNLVIAVPQANRAISILGGGNTPGAVGMTLLGNTVTVPGNVTAAYFAGDGTLLTNNPFSAKILNGNTVFGFLAPNANLTINVVQTDFTGANGNSYGGVYANSVVLGSYSGNTNLNQVTALGPAAAQSNPASFATAVGAFAGQTNMPTGATVVGYAAGQANLTAQSTIVGAIPGNIQSNANITIIGSNVFGNIGTNVTVIGSNINITANSSMRSAVIIGANAIAGQMLFTSGIVLNATGNALSNTTTLGGNTFITSIRQSTANNWVTTQNQLLYNPQTYELTYSSPTVGYSQMANTAGYQTPGAWYQVTGNVTMAGSLNFPAGTKFTMMAQGAAPSSNVALNAGQGSSGFFYAGTSSFGQNLNVQTGETIELTGRGPGGGAEYDITDGTILQRLMTGTTAPTVVSKWFYSYNQSSTLYFDAFMFKGGSTNQSQLASAKGTDITIMGAQFYWYQTSSTAPTNSTSQNIRNQTINGWWTVWQGAFATSVFYSSGVTQKQITGQFWFIDVTNNRTYRMNQSQGTRMVTIERLA